MTPITIMARKESYEDVSSSQKMEEGFQAKIRKLRMELEETAPEEGLGKKGKKGGQLKEDMHVGTFLPKCLFEAFFRAFCSKKAAIQMDPDDKRTSNPNLDTAAAQHSTEPTRIATPTPTAQSIMDPQHPTYSSSISGSSERLPAHQGSMNRIQYNSSVACLPVIGRGDDVGEHQPLSSCLAFNNAQVTGNKRTYRVFNYDAFCGPRPPLRRSVSNRLHPVKQLHLVGLSRLSD